MARDGQGGVPAGDEGPSPARTGPLWEPIRRDGPAKTYSTWTELFRTPRVGLLQRLGRTEDLLAAIDAAQAPCRRISVAVDLQPFCAELLQWKSEALIPLQRWDELADVLQAQADLLAQEWHRPECRRLLGQICQRLGPFLEELGRWEEALAAYDRSIAAWESLGFDPEVDKLRREACLGRARAMPSRPPPGGRGRDPAID